MGEPEPKPPESRAGVPRTRLRAGLITAAGLFALWAGVQGSFTCGENEGDGRPPIDLRVGEEVTGELAEELAEETAAAAPGAATPGPSGRSPETGPSEAPPGTRASAPASGPPSGASPPSDGKVPAPTFHERLLALAGAYVAGKLDLDRLRDRLSDLRLDTNLTLINETMRARTAWLDRLGALLDLLSLGALVLLLGPWWVRRRVAPGAVPPPWRMSVPYFVVTAAVVLWMFKLLGGLVVGVEKLQVSVAAFGTPTAAAADAVLHYVVFGADAELEHLLRLVLSAPEAVRENPLAGLGVLGGIWMAVQGALDSTALWLARHTFSLVVRALHLYGPLLAAATLLVAYRTIVPLVRSLVRYPLDALSGAEAPGLGRFVLRQLGLLWKEIRAAAWMLLFVLVFTVLAVAVVRVLTFGAVVVLIRTLLAASTAVLSGAGLPDAGLLCALLSVALLLLLVAGICLGAAAVVFGRAYPVVRARLHEKRRFRRFPLFWRMVRRLGSRVVWPLLLSAGALLALYFLALDFLDDPTLRVWLPAALGPLLALLLWRLRVFSRLWRLARLDPLAPPAGPLPEPSPRGWR
ncbi:MAG: hypothetical protein GYA57_06675 [Myxococcales bacterium]|nr:hypothetical protein [Myxococcales bacterium]